MDENKKHHHFLISGSIIFVNQKEEIGTVALNGVLIQDRRDIPVKSLGKAQQILQMNFRKNSGADDSVKVVDVVLHNFVHLGEFTKEEFQQPPQGLSQQEAQAEINAVLANGHTPV